MTTLLPSLRIPAIRPPAPRVAQVWGENPATAVYRHFLAVHRERMSGLPFLNPAIEVALADCRRVEGDWLATVVTPWSLQLVLLPGGGTLWRDTACGTRHVVAFPAGEVAFIGDEGEADLPAYQYFPLIAPVDGIADTQAAIAVLRDALAALLEPPPPAPAPAVPPAETVSSSRRAFLRGAFGS